MALVGVDSGEAIWAVGLVGDLVFLPVGGELCGVELAVGVVGDTCAGRDGVLVGLGAQRGGVSGLDGGGEEFGDAAGSVAEEADGLCAEGGVVVEEGGKG